MSPCLTAPPRGTAVYTYVTIIDISQSAANRVAKGYRVRLDGCVSITG